MDTITLARIALLHPSIRKEVGDLINKANALLTSHSQIRIVQGLRTFPEQDALYAQGRTTPGKKITNAKGGQSIHNYGLAIDFALLIDNTTISWDLKKDWDGDKIPDWMEVVNVFKNAGYHWGGDWVSFKDYPHIEKRGDWKNLLIKYNAKDFIPGTKYVNL